MAPIGRRLAPVGTEGPSERQLPPVRPVEKEEMKKKTNESSAIRG